MLEAIGIIESGRFDASSAKIQPWPWSINVAGDDRVFDNMAEAIAAVQAARAAGVQSIDVGCMQINLMYHPAAFASLEQAFDPQTNAVYAASFLNHLFVQTGDWRKAAAAYHSQTPGVSDVYARRVIALWPLAARYVTNGSDAPGDTIGHELTCLTPRADQGRSYQSHLSTNANTITPELRTRLAQNEADSARWLIMGLLPQSVAPARLQTSEPHCRRLAEASTSSH